MTINDDDKKFIKDTINDAIDSKLESYEAKTESKQRLNELKKEKQEKEDRKALIAELRDRDKKGENTLAQKMELLKLSVDNVIPKDVKNALSAAGKGVQSGASQIGSGISHLTGKAMMTNPLTALLWQNRDIFKALGDIGIGGLKVGASVLGGASGAVFGALGSLFNRGKGDSQEDTEPKESKKKKVVTIGKGDKVEVVEENEGAAALLEEKKNWKKQIDEIHKEVTQDLKDATRDRKSGNMILSKGLDGLKGSMDKVKEFTSEIASKSKAILAGVLLAGVGILALVGWFKGGGLVNLFNKVVNKKNPNVTKVPEAFKETQITPDQSNESVIKDVITPNNNNIDSLGTTHKFGVHHTKFTNYAKSAGVSENILNNKVNPDAGSNMLTDVNASQKTLLTFDFPVMVHRNYLENDKVHLSLRILRCYMDERTKKYVPIQNMTLNGVHGALDNYVSITVTRALKQLVPKQRGIPNNTPIALMDTDYKILGDLTRFLSANEAGMITGDEATNRVDFVKSHNQFKETFAGNYDKFRDEATKNQQKTQADKRAKGYKTTETLKGAKEAVTDLFSGSEDKQKDSLQTTTDDVSGEKTSLNITGTNVSENNLQKQNETIASLNKKEEVVKPQVINEPAVDSKENNTIAVNVENPIDVKWPTLLNLGEVNVALQNDYEIS